MPMILLNRPIYLFHQLVYIRPAFSNIGLGKPSNADYESYIYSVFVKCGITSNKITTD
jgi:hypothetical protein